MGGGGIGERGGNQCVWINTVWATCTQGHGNQHGIPGTYMITIIIYIFLHYQLRLCFLFSWVMFLLIRGERGGGANTKRPILLTENSCLWKRKDSQVDKFSVNNSITTRGFFNFFPFPVSETLVMGGGGGIIPPNLKKKKVWLLYSTRSIAGCD